MARDPSPATAGLCSVDIRARTDGLTLCIALEHRFRNDSDVDVEVAYSFPIPTDAAILGFSATIDGRTAGPVPPELGGEPYEAALEAGGFAAELDRRRPGLCAIALGRLKSGEAATTTTVWARFIEVWKGGGRIVAPVSAAAPEGSDLVGPFGPERADLLADYDLTFDLVLDGPAAQANVSSPSHSLQRGSRGKEAFVSLSERAFLDRDVVINLAGLPSADGVLAGPGLGYVAALRAPLHDRPPPRPRDLEVWIDAAGPLGPRIRDGAELLQALAGALNDDDLISVSRIGRTATPVLDRTARAAEALDHEALRTLTADLGDLPIGTDRLPSPMRSDADLLLITDGRTRLAEAVCRQARAAGKRLFVLGAGAAPSEALLRPAALATGGDYIALAPFEALEPAVERLLAGIGQPPARPEMPRWASDPVWSKSLGAAMAGLGDLIVAGFAAPPSPQVAFARAEATLRLLDPRHDPLALPTMMLALERAMRDGADDAVQVWAARAGVRAERRWTAVLSRRGDKAPEREPHLVLSPQMMTAGERGLGRLSPIATPPQPPEPPPYRQDTRRPRSRGRASVMSFWSGLGQLVLSALAALRSALLALIGRQPLR